MKLLWVCIYNGIVYPLIFLLACLLSVFNGKLGQGISGRFQSLSKLNQYFKSRSHLPMVYWFHAASLGEFYQVKPVLEGLKDVKPEIKTIVSFSSPSGFDNAKSTAIDLKIFMPFDFLWSVRKALKIVRPKKVIFASYDIWPNMIWIAGWRQIHTNMFAARVKDGSLKLLPGFLSFYRSIFRSLSTIYTVVEKDRKRIRTIVGKVNKPAIKVLGNPRYDMVMKSADDFTTEHTRSVLSREKRIIIGSAHEEDDQFLIPTLARFIDSHPEIKVLYSHHEPSEAEIERLKALFLDQGYSATVFRKKKNLALPPDPVIILGVVGVLSKLYWQGQIAFVGGGLSTGIHNVMEPAIARLPVLFGPKYHHAHEAEELLESGGGFCVTSKDEFEAVIQSLIQDDDYFTQASLAATYVIHKNLGSSTRIIRSLIRD